MLTLKKYFLFIIILSVCGAAIGYNLAKFLPSGYKQTQLFFLTPETAQDQDTNLGKYFIQENSRNFTDTAVAILQSTEFQSEVLKPGQVLTVRKIAPQVIRLTYTHSTLNSDDPKLIDVAGHFNQKIENLLQSTSSAQLKPIEQVSEPSFSALNKYVLLAGGFLIGALFAVFIIGLKVYLKL